MDWDELSPEAKEKLRKLEEEYEKNGTKNLKFIPVKKSSKTSLPATQSADVAA